MKTPEERDVIILDICEIICYNHRYIYVFSHAWSGHYILLRNGLLCVIAFSYSNSCPIMTILHVHFHYDVLF